MSGEDLLKLVSILPIAGAAVKYLLSLDEKSGETLLKLEARFDRFFSPWGAIAGGTNTNPGIARLIDPETRLYEDSELKKVVERSITSAAQKRDAASDVWMAHLDEFLRFLLIVANMEKTRLLQSEVLIRNYGYWYWTVWRTKTIRNYIELYFPDLCSFCREHEYRWNGYEKSAAPVLASPTAAPARQLNAPLPEG